MSFEDEVNRLNEYFFFKEFTYANNRFRKPDGQEVEVADSIIYLDEISFVFQIKERKNSLRSTADTEKKWFRNKVIKLGTKQIRDTLFYIGNYDSVFLKNNRGDSINIPSTALSTIQKIVIHYSHALLPDECRDTKFHRSDTAGIIHVFQGHDYFGIIHYLITPAEVAEHLRFRGDLIKRHGEEINRISEPAILGQYVSGNYDDEASEDFTRYLSQLNKNIDRWDMTGIIKRFPKRVAKQQQNSDYYYIIKEIAKLMRNELAIFKERFMLSWEAAKDDSSVLPYRFHSPRTGCTFLFLPLTQKEKETRTKALTSLTLANKYDLKSDKSIGVSFISDTGGWQDVEWCFVEETWQEDPEFSKLLQEHYPFRPVTQQRIDRYKFGGDS